MSQIWNDMKTHALADLPSLGVIAWDLIKILVFYILARLVIRVAIRIMERVFNIQHVRMDDRRKATMTSLFANVIRYTVYFILVIEILTTLGVNVAALLAGAGIVGVAVGLGAQSVIKDFLTGLLILFEDQYAVGDVVQINGFTGTVVSVGVRLTRIQAWTGELEIVPNGQITTVTNYSRTNSTAVIDVGIAYSSDIAKAKSIMERVLREMKEEHPDTMVGDVTVSGVTALSASSVDLRATAICAPNSSAGIQREAQERIKLAFDEAGIEIPYPQTTVWLKQPTSEDKGGEPDASAV
ncbi:mechanosensitive ion channel family protein [Alicyclobacillus acidiphilus]|uniref:mechanosensitive ion channel family protein n=1 Tax=Alicyclobacillus acidiphilus TaxID=182455 RepID=UPI00082D61BC|nr:mechanosensitive ion channel family protein [Alicyclobacillus acidiphilus]